MKSIVGEKAYKQTGYFAYRVGIVEESKSITPYILKFNDGTSIGINEKDVVICGEIVNKK